MKPWGMRPIEPIEDKAAAIAMAQAVYDAIDMVDLHGADSMLIMDLHTGMQTRYVTWPIHMHTHDQNCRRA